MPRFKEIVSTQKIVDTKTKKEYNGLVDDELLDLINNLTNKDPIEIIDNKIWQLQNQIDFSRHKWLNFENKKYTIKILNEIKKELIK